MTPQFHNYSEKPAVFRPDQGLWILIVILMGVALVIPVMMGTGARPLTSPDDQWAAAMICAMFGVPTLATVWYLIRCRVLTDTNGITLVGYFQTRVVPWAAIEDYELRIPSSSQSKSGLPIGYLKIAGKWRLLSRSYLPYDALLERIAERAKWSKATEWQRNDIRDDGDWPKTFEYRDASGWKYAGQAFLFSFALIALNLMKVATYGWQMFLSKFRGTSWTDILPLLLLFLPITALVSLIFWARYAEVKACRRFSGQKIVASHNGLLYLKSGAELFVPWEEIQRYYKVALPGNLQPTLCVIEGVGHRIEFVTGIEGVRILCALVISRATNANTKSWTFQHGADEDLLGGAASLWQGGHIGAGHKRYHYRTRTARAMLFMGVCMSGAFAMQLSSGYLGNGRPMTTGDYWCGAIMFGPLTAMTIAGFLSFLFSNVQCEEGGLRQNGVWSKRFLRWDEMESLETNGAYFLLSGKTSKLRISGLIADSAGFMEEIEKRSGLQFKKNEKAF